MTMRRAGALVYFFFAMGGCALETAGSDVDDIVIDEATEGLTRTIIFDPNRTVTYEAPLAPLGSQGQGPGDTGGSGSSGGSTGGGGGGETGGDSDESGGDSDDGVTVIPCNAEELERSRSDCESTCESTVNHYYPGYGWTCTAQPTCKYICQAVAPRQPTSSPEPH